MRNVGTTLPLPRTLLGNAQGMRVNVLRSHLHLSRSPHLYEEQGERVLRVRNTPPSVKGAVGFAQLKGLRDLLMPTVGDLVDFKAAFSCLAPHSRLWTLPVFPGNTEQTREHLEPVLRRLVEPATQSQQGAVDTRMLSRLLEDLCVRQRDGCFSSVEWHSHLLSCVDGRDAAVPQADERVVPRGRVAVMGYLAGLPDLYELVEYLGGRVVYDEWAEAAASLVLAEDPYHGIAHAPFVLGLEARIRLLQELDDRLDAVIFVSEPFSALAVEETWFRNVIKLPLLSLECSRLGLMDSGQQLRLENFARTTFGRAES
jgi:hypothetical protein